MNIKQTTTIIGKNTCNIYKKVGKAAIKINSGFNIIDTNILDWKSLRQQNLYPVFSLANPNNGNFVLLPHIYIRIKDDVNPDTFAKNKNLKITKILEKNELLVENLGEEDPIDCSNKLRNSDEVIIAEIDYATEIKKY